MSNTGFWAWMHHKQFHHPTIVVHLQFLFLTTHPACTRDQCADDRLCQSVCPRSFRKASFTSRRISFFAIRQLQNNQTIYCPLWPRGPATNPSCLRKTFGCFTRTKIPNFEAHSWNVVSFWKLFCHRRWKSDNQNSRRRWKSPDGDFFPGALHNPRHKHRSLHTPTIVWRPWMVFWNSVVLTLRLSNIDQKSAKSTTLTEKIRAILLPKNGGGGTHSSQQLVRYHVHDTWPSVHDAWLFSRKMHVATYSIWDSRVRYYQQILWFHDFTR